MVNAPTCSRQPLPQPVARYAIIRRILLLAATLFTTATTSLRLTDTHNGLRAFTRRGALALRLR
jgi:hypothetical protein